MITHSLGNKETEVSEAIHPSTSGAGKKNWQAPELTEMDYDQTNAGFTGIGGDFGIYS